MLVVIVKSCARFHSGRVSECEYAPDCVCVVYFI